MKKKDNTQDKVLDVIALIQGNVFIQKRILTVF